MVDGVYMASKSKEENLLTINHRDRGNHSSESECYFSVNLNNGKADNEKEVRDLVSSVTYSSCVESSQSASVVESPHFPVHRHPSEKLVAYMDKNVMECELQESKLCYQDVKDICVDEGVPTRNPTFREVDENKTCTFLPAMDSKKEVMKEVNSDALILYALDSSSQEDSGKHATYLHRFENSVQVVGTDTVVDDVGKKMDLTESKTELHELNEETTGCTCEESKFNCEETVSGDPALPSTSDVSNSDNLATDCNNTPDNGGVTSQFSSRDPSTGRDDIQKESEHTTDNGQEVSERDFRNTRITSELAHCRYDSRDDSGYLQHGFGESSFIAVGTSPSLINHSSLIAYSGSVSLRSDSSTTSTRSFAFPILQTEWNSSPVRMAKAEGRRSRKCRSWRDGLLCCRF